MIKNTFRISLIFVFLFCFFGSCYAINTTKVYLSSDKQMLKKGEEVEITVNIEGMKTSAFNISLYFDPSKWEYVSHLENTNVVENRILYVWYDVNGGNNFKQGNLVTFKFKAKEEGMTTFSIEGSFYHSTGQLIQTHFEGKQIEITEEEKSLQNPIEEKGVNKDDNNANLQALRLDREGLIPNFQQQVYEYDITIPNEVNEIKIWAISENEKATVEVQGNTNLQEGLNDIRIRVISADKTQEKVYSIQVTKTNNLGLTNTNLEILAMEDVLLTPPFEASHTYYQAEVAHHKKDIHLLAVPEDERSIIEIMGNENLQEGNNLVTVTVTAPNGFTKRKYQVEVYRRNLEDEQKYQEQQKNNLEQLEEIVEIQEVNTHITEVQENKTKEQNNKMIGKMIGIMVITIIFIVFMIVFFLNKKRKNNMNLNR